jgi:hypothetical protein
MRQIIDDVAVCLNGFIVGSSDDVGAFPAESDCAAAYRDRLRSHGTAIMARPSYELGCRFGLWPGVRAYPNMDHTSSARPRPARALRGGRDTRRLEGASRAAAAGGGGADPVRGGGAFADWVAADGLIDRRRLKVAPIP